MSRGFAQFARAVAAGLLALFGAMVLPSSTRGSAGDELLVNGGFGAGDGAVPAGWHAYAVPDCGTHFDRHKAKDSAAEIEIDNENAAASGIVQSVIVSPGWYHLTGEIRTRDIHGAGSGAQFGLRSGAQTLETPEEHGTNDWQRVGLYFGTQAERRKVAVVCKLGTTARESAGTAFFRAVSLTPVAARPAHAHTYDLDLLDRVFGSDSGQIRPPSTGNWLVAALVRSRLSLIVVFAGLFLVTGCGLYLARDETRDPPLV